MPTLTQTWARAHFHRFKQTVAARKQSSEVDFLMTATLCGVIDRSAFFFSQRGGVEPPRRKTKGRRNWLFWEKMCWSQFEKGWAQIPAGLRACATILPSATNVQQNVLIPPVWNVSCLVSSVLLNFKNTRFSVHFSLNKLRFWWCYATRTKSQHEKKCASTKQVIKNELWKLHRSRFSSGKPE